MWEINIADQVYTFLFALLLGAVFCLLYDIIRAVRKAGADSFASAFAGDIFFWIISAFATFLFLLARTNGEIRGYALFAIAMGFASARFTLSPIIFKALRIIVGFIAALIRKTSVAVAFVCCRIQYALMKAGTFLKSVFYGIASVIKKLLKSMRRLLYTKKNSLESGQCADEEKA